jgi:hypothetical protein
VLYVILKSIFLNLIHQADISVQGQTLESTQAYINISKHFQVISEMSEDDLKTLGHSVGFSPVLDHPRSARYNPTQAGAATHSGNVLCNNRPFPSASEFQVHVDTSMSLVQNGIYGIGGLMTVTNLAAEFRPYYEFISNYMLWYDFAVFKLNHLLESIDHIGLTQKLDASLRLWLNCGTVKYNCWKCWNSCTNGL